MQFELEKNYQEGKDRFVHYNDDHKVDAEVDLTVDNDQKTYTIMSTKTDPTLRGRGIGGQLMLSVVDLARKNNYRIINVCSYAVKFFDKHQTDYADVLK